MKFLDKFKKNRELDTSSQMPSRQSENNSSNYRKMIDLFKADANTGAILAECIGDPGEYYKGHADRYDERGITQNADDDTIIWLGIVDALIESGKVFEFDYDVELEDFIYGMKEINRENHLVMDENLLDEDADITAWTRILSKQWSGDGYVVAAMDIDSDSYCVFVAATEVFNELAAAAAETGHKIDLAQNM